MKKILPFLVALMFTVSCATVKVEAPSGSSIKLAPEVSPYNYTAKKRIFYVLWGLVPITDNSTASMLQGKNVTEVKVKTYTDVVDILISAVLGNFSIVSRTVEVDAKVSE